MRALLITAEVRLAIADALRRAPRVSRETLMRWGKPASETPQMTFADRPPGLERPPSAHVLIPHGFRASISLEDQPGVGWCRHLSVSVDGEPGNLPHPAAVQMIAEEFGCWPALHVWPEEYKPGKWCVNVIGSDGLAETKGNA